MRLRILLLCALCCLALGIDDVEPILEQFVDSDDYPNDAPMGEGTEMYDMNEMEGGDEDAFFDGSMGAEGFGEGMDPALAELLQQMFGGGGYAEGDDLEGGDGGGPPMFMDTDDFGGQWQPDPSEDYEDEFA